MLARSLSCPDCGWRTTCGSADIASRLRLVGLLRRDPDPDDEILSALLPDAAQRMTCPGCKRIGLVVQSADLAQDDEWQDARLCEKCRKPIPEERVDAFPNAKHCVGCQAKAESGESDEFYFEL